jgi:tetratricopeptide (TPR) repeat protein
MMKTVLCLLLCAAASLWAADKKKTTAVAKPDSTAKALAAAATVDDSIKVLKTAIFADSSRADLVYKLGLIYYVDKQWYAKAIESWNRVAQLEPKNGLIKFQIAWACYRKLHNLPAAEIAALQAVELGAVDKEKKYWYTLSTWMLASIYETKGDSLNAQRHRDEWLKLSALVQPKPEQTLEYLNQEVEALRKELEAATKH